jgi:hypothetical protein
MKVDMSAQTVAARLQLVSQLRRLCLELGKMKPVASTKTADANIGAPETPSPMEPFEPSETLRPEPSTRE